MLNEKFPHDQDIAVFSHYLAKLLDEKEILNERLGLAGEGSVFGMELYRHIAREPLADADEKRAWCMAAAHFLLIEEAVDCFFTYRESQAVLLEYLRQKFPEEKDLEGFSHYLAANLQEAAKKSRLKNYKRECHADRRANAFSAHLFRSVEERRIWCAETDEFIGVEQGIKDFFKLRNRLLALSQKDMCSLAEEARSHASTMESIGYYKYNGDEEDDEIYYRLSAKYEKFLEHTRFQYRRYLASLMHQAEGTQLRSVLLECFKAEERLNRYYLKNAHRRVMRCS